MEHPADWPDDDIRAAIEAEIDDASGEDDELASEPTDEEAPAGPESITSHILRCRQGLNNQYVYDDSTFRPPSTGIVYTRVAFYDANMQRLLLTAWKNMGSANPYRTMINRWTWRSTAVRRALVLWFINGYTWRSWANC